MRLVVLFFLLLHSRTMNQLTANKQFPADRVHGSNAKNPISTSLAFNICGIFSFHVDWLKQEHFLPFSNI